MSEHAVSAWPRVTDLCPAHQDTRADHLARHHESAVTLAIRAIARECPDCRPDPDRGDDE